jgi:hypothetical protein
MAIIRLNSGGPYAPLFLSHESFYFQCFCRFQGVYLSPKHILNAKDDGHAFIVLGDAILKRVPSSYLPASYQTHSPSKNKIKNPYA